MTLQDMQGKFSHFGYTDGVSVDVEPRYKVQFDGYSFGDRLLEGVIFDATIKNGILSVNVSDQCKQYFNQLNQKMWLETAIEYAIRNDVFDEDEVSIIMNDGRCSFEWID